MASYTQQPNRSLPRNDRQLRYGSR